MNTRDPGQQRIEAVLFDLDGTLMETVHDLAATLNQVFAEHQMPQVPIDHIEEQASNGIAAMLTLSSGRTPEPEKLIYLRQRFFSIYEERLKTQCITPLYPGIEALLSTLEQQTIPWGIVTNKPKSFSTLLLKWHNLTERCAILICPEDVKETKPSPEPLIKACHFIGCNPKKCVYIGDHERDIIAGTQAGMKTIAACYGYLEKGAKPGQWQATFNALKPADILQWLQKTH